MVPRLLKGGCGTTTQDPRRASLPTTRRVSLPAGITRSRPPGPMAAPCHPGDAGPPSQASRSEDDAAPGGVGDDHVVEETEADGLGGLTETGGGLQIGCAGVEGAAGMIVRQAER